MTATSHLRVPLTTTGVDRLTLHVLLAGPETGTPVVLLHGFPDFSAGWRRQVATLADAGYRVIVPDQRGYGGSDKPAAVGAYRLKHLARDVVALLDILGIPGPAHVVGHDWGGGVAWATAILHPDRVRTLTVVACPQPEVLRRCLVSNPVQVAKSAYILAFQVPVLPERWLASGGVEAILSRFGGDDVFTTAERDRYRRAFPLDACRGAVNWYRAAFRSRAPDGPITAPTLLVWGGADPILGTELATASLAGCTDGRLEVLPGAGHFVPHAHADQLDPLLLDHLGAHGGPDPFVYKIADGATWDAAPDPWPGMPDDLRDGFVHLSARDQVRGTLDKHFAGRAGLRLLAVDPGRLPPGALRWEVSRGGKRFPHLHAPLPKAAVVRETPVT